MTIEELRNKIISTLKKQKNRIIYDERDDFYNYGIDTCIGYVEDIFKEYEVSKNDC
jgi:hypothetical protein